MMSIKRVVIVWCESCEASSRSIRPLHRGHNIQGVSMATTSHTLLSQLIGTVRNLNHDIGVLSGNVPDEVLGTLIAMRDGELHDAQAIKEALSGVPSAHAGEGSPVLGAEAEQETLPTVLSQFGTARETILSMLRELDDAGWQHTTSDGTTIHDRVTAIVARDAEAVQRIYAAAGKSLPVTPTEAG
jgi:hypothetical protein